MIGCPVCTPGATGPVCPACLANAPMRLIQHGRCTEADCGHAWIASKIGACPKCHSDATTTDGSHTNGLKRL